MKRFKQLILAAFVVTGVGVMALPPPSASAVDVFKQCGTNKDAAVCKSTGDDATNMVKVIVNMLLYVLGIIAVIMIIIGGIRYTTSGGDAPGLKSARDTIIYAVVGLVIAIMSFAIVNFVLGWF
jgi:hypothetical protein